jgi:hypothetical protein
MGTYASAILISGTAVAIGRGICVLAGNDGATWLSPAVGFAALMILCNVAVKLPGRGWTAVVAVVAVTAASIWVGAKPRTRWPSMAEAIPVAVVVIGFLTLPFLANARIGVLGVSVLDDTRWHLIFAEGLLHPAIQPIGYGAGYPLGPHAVAATFAQALGTGVDKSLTGVLIATPILTGLTALGALEDIPRWRRCFVAVLAAVPYLLAAWYVQSAFKEPILALLLVGLVLALQSGRSARFNPPVATVIPVAVLIAGSLYDYSYPGLAWMVGAIACWILLELLRAHRQLHAIWRRVKGSVPALGLGLLVFVLLVGPELRRIHTFWYVNSGTAAGSGGGLAGPLANLVKPLPPLEGLNIWLSGDFRFEPSGALWADVLPILAVIVLVFAIVSAFARDDLPWIGAVLASGLIYVYAKHTRTEYYAAKALVVPASVLILGSGAALMRAIGSKHWRSLSLPVVFGAAIAFFFFAFDSSYRVLRDAHIGPNDQTIELRSLRRFLHNRPALVLFTDVYVQWELLGESVSSPVLPSPIPTKRQPKLWSYGQPFDFDSVDAATLDQYDYVITTRTTAQSIPPPNFHLVGASRSYQVWQRVGPTPPHSFLPAERAAPGAVLDCRTPAGRQIARGTGYAVVRPAPRYFAIAPLRAGGSEHVVFRLPAGDWYLSLPYASDQAVTVRGRGLEVRLPPALDKPGNIWPVGRVRSTGTPVVLRVHMSDPGLLGSEAQQFIPEQLIAVSAAPARIVPLRDACGRYVDWYAATLSAMPVLGRAA